MNTLPLFLLAAFLTLLAQAADPLSEALQRGLLAEEAQRDLAAAAVDYQEAVQLGDTQRAVVATALFRLAEVQRRLGQTNEAALSYERLLREFGEQTNLTAIAARHVPSVSLSNGRASLSLTRTELDQATAELKQLSDDQVELAGLRKRFEAQRRVGNWLELSQDMAVAAPTPELTRLRSERNKTEVQLASLSVEFGPQHPERLQVTARLAKIDEQIQGELRIIERDLEARDASLTRRVEQQRLRVQMLRSQISAAGHAGLSGPLADESSEARRLLMEEIALAEQQLEVARKKLEVGRGETEEVLKASRELLALKRQLAAIPVLQAAAAVAAPELEDDEDREIARLQRMLTNSPDLLNAPQGSDNETPLQTAASRDQARVVEYLLKAGADINALGSSGVTALFKAASAGHKRMVDLLLRSGAKVDARGEGNSTPLLGAVARERAKVIQTLLAAGASPTIQCGEGGVSTRLGPKGRVSPLGLAALLGDRALVEQMVRGGADPNVPALGRQSTLENARIRGDWAMISLLLELGADLNLGKADANQTLLEALVQSKNVPTSILDQVLARGGRLDVINAGGDSLLHLAIRSGATNAVPWLLAHRVEPDLVNQKGMSPLMELMAQFIKMDPSDEQTQVLEQQLEALLANKVNVNREIPNSGAPLSWLLWNSSTNVFQRLLIAGADPDSVDPNGSPLLCLLARYSAIVLPPQARDPKSIALANARALLQAGANPNAECGGTTPLNAALESSPEMVQLLLDFKADPNRRDGSGRTALEQLAIVRLNSPSLPYSPSKESLAQIETILRAGGARVDVPDFGIIRLVRPSSEFAQVIFRRNGTNDANRYTLLEALAVHYNLVLAPRVAMTAPKPSGVPVVIGRGGVAVSGRPGVAMTPTASPASLPRGGFSQFGLQFPDWKRVVIRRPEPDGSRWTEIPVNVAEILAEGGCERDVVLKWGDVIEVPERDHPVGGRASSVPSELLGAWQKCLARSVTFTVGGRTEKRRQGLQLGGADIQSEQDTFTLIGALNGSHLVRTSSDTSRVLLRRPDPTTGKTTEITVNCRDADGEGGTFWLREGDEIVVPDLR